MSMKYRILIFGAGAIGTYIGFHLLQGNHQVVFLEREKDQDDLRRRGLKMELEGQIQIIPTAATISDLALLKQDSYDLIILALKTYHLDEILPDLKSLKDNLPPILCLQNGIESERILKKELGTDLVIPGTMTTAVDRVKKGEIIVQRSRGIGIAGDHPLVTNLVLEFNNTGLSTTYYHQPDDMKWSKLILNLLGNASAAILNMSVAEIYKDPRLFRMERQQILETISVMDHQGIDVINLPGVPVRLLVSIFKYLPPVLSQPLLSSLIGGGRGDKMPSFHVDLHRGRGKSEVDHLNGAVARLGTELNLSTPVNRTLTDVLTKLIAGKESLEKYDHNPTELLDKILG